MASIPQPPDGNFLLYMPQPRYKMSFLTLDKYIHAQELSKLCSVCCNYHGLVTSKTMGVLLFVTAN